MRLFLDASALVAIIVKEPERETLTARLLAASVLLWSSMTCWETVVALIKSNRVSVEAARGTVEAASSYFGFALVPIADQELRIALDAFEKYGKGRHPAQLNFGDCFAYACAKTNNAALLYKGDDFSKTDLA